MSELSRTPADVPIVPRQREFEIAQALGRDWYDDHAFKTAWFNAMSVTFPLGEKFFIDSVRHYADHIDDEGLCASVRGFCGQEGFHRREHQRYNATLCQERGYDLQVMEGRLEHNIQRAYRFLSPMQRLASTAALEHITAILAELILSEDDLMANSTDSAMAALWRWHAAEEMEHKSVAFDVYRAVGGTEKMRKRAMVQSTFFLLVDILSGLLHMLRRDKKLWSIRLWSQGWKFLSFKGGILRRAWPAYKEYFRDNFHPWDRDTRPLLQSWKHGEAAALAS